MTLGLVKGSSTTDSLYYGVSIHQDSVTRSPQVSRTFPYLVSRSQTAAKAVWPRETSLHPCSAHCSKIDRTFDGVCVCVCVGGCVCLCDVCVSVCKCMFASV